MEKQRKAQASIEKNHGQEIEEILKESSQFIIETRFFILHDCFSRKKFWQVNELHLEVNRQLKKNVGITEHVDIETIQLDLHYFREHYSAPLKASKQGNTLRYSYFIPFTMEYAPEDVAYLEMLVSVLSGRDYFMADERIRELILRVKFLILENIGIETTAAISVPASITNQLIHKN